MEQTVKRRSSIKIMASMIGLVKPLAHIMAAAVILGTLGYLCAIFLTITAGICIKSSTGWTGSHRIFQDSSYSSSGKGHSSLCGTVL